MPCDRTVGTLMSGRRSGRTVKSMAASGRRGHAAAAPPVMTFSELRACDVLGFVRQHNDSNRKGTDMTASTVVQVRPRGDPALTR